MKKTLSVAAAAAIGAGLFVAVPAEAAPAPAHAAMWFKTRTKITSHGANRKHVWVRGQAQVKHGRHWVAMDRPMTHLYWKWPKGTWHHAAKQRANTKGYVKLWAGRHKGAIYKLHVFKNANPHTLGSKDQWWRFRG